MTSDQLCACGCGGHTKFAAINDKKRGVTKGDPNRYLHGHHCKGRPRLDVTRRYRTQYRRGQSSILLHRLRAEKALGKPLPKGALVHHADGSMADDAPLVICQDERYHRLLHIRMRVKAHGGDPNRDLYCGECQTVKPRTDFYIRRGKNSGRCYACRTAYNQRAWVEEKARGVA